MEPNHSSRLKEVLFGTDFVLLPRYVFFALSKWFSCNLVIERKVIQYHQDKDKAKAMFRQKRSQSNTTIAVNERFIKVVGDVTYELEIYPKYMYYEKITDKGERPHIKSITQRRIDPAYIKKNSGKLPFHELLVSRKSTFEDVLRQMS